MKNLKADRIRQSNDQKYRIASVSYTGKETSNAAEIFGNLNVKEAFKAQIDLKENAYGIREHLTSGDSSVVFK
jgi:hypothetical protein